jgi:hypothetical protein
MAIRLLLFAADALQDRWADAIREARRIRRIKPLVDELAPKLNAYLRSIGPLPRVGPRGNERLVTDNAQLTTDH